jgi:hypothetical protein
MLYYTMYKIAAEPPIGTIADAIKLHPVTAGGSLGLSYGAMPLLSYIYGENIERRGTPKQKKRSRVTTHLSNAIIGGLLTSAALSGAFGSKLKSFEYALPFGLFPALISSAAYERGRHEGKSRKTLEDRLTSLAWRLAGQ